MFGFACDKGIRPTMEDAHVMEPQFSATHAFYGVFDGHGGITSAEYAAQHLPNHVKKNLQLSNENEALKQGFLSCDSELIAATQDVHQGGATAVCALLSPTRIFVANAGDARAILVQKSSHTALSRDHKAGKDYEKQRLVQSNTLGKVILVPTMPSRGFGDWKFKMPFVSKEKPHVCKDLVTAEPEIMTHDRDAANDVYLILACDGVWDKVKNEEAADLARKCENAQQAAEQLMQHALAKKTMDNVSVLVVKL